MICIGYTAATVFLEGLNAPWGCLIYITAVAFQHGEILVVRIWDERKGEEEKRAASFVLPS